jgi:hypothetical protein
VGIPRVTTLQELQRTGEQKMPRKETRVLTWRGDVMRDKCAVMSRENVWSLLRRDMSELKAGECRQFVRPKKLL